MTLSGEILSEHPFSFILSSFEVALCSNFGFYMLKFASRLAREQFIVQPRNLRARVEVWGVQRRLLGISWWLEKPSSLPLSSLISSTLSSILSHYQPLKFSTIAPIISTAPKQVLLAMPSKLYSWCLNRGNYHDAAQSTLTRARATKNKRRAKFFRIPVSNAELEVRSVGDIKTWLGAHCIFSLFALPLRFHFLPRLLLAPGSQQLNGHSF